MQTRRQLYEVLEGQDDRLEPRGVSVVKYVNSLVAKHGESICYGLTGYNSGATQFIQVFDASILPANGAVPVTVLSAPAQSNFSIDYGPYGRSFLVGVIVCNSSTGPTLTIGSADCWFDVVLL